jgi:hypothetical protein
VPQGIARILDVVRPLDTYRQYGPFGGHDQVSL